MMIIASRSFMMLVYVSKRMPSSRSGLQNVKVLRSQKQDHCLAIVFSRRDLDTESSLVRSIG